MQRRNRIWLWEVSCSHRCFMLVISHSKHRKLNIIFPRNMKDVFYIIWNYCLKINCGIAEVEFDGSRQKKGKIIKVFLFTLPNDVWETSHSQVRFNMHMTWRGCHMALIQTLADTRTFKQVFPRYFEILVVQNNTYAKHCKGGAKKTEGVQPSLVRPSSFKLQAWIIEP